MKGRERWLGGGPFLDSLVFVFPLLVIYDVGVLFSSGMNGVDVLTQALAWVSGDDRKIYLLGHAVGALLYLVVLLFLHRQRRVDTHAFVPMVLESGIYALSLGTLIVFVMENLLGFQRYLSMALDLGIDPRRVAQVIGAIGAGVHEEIIFRLVGFGGLLYLMRKFDLRSRVALPLAALVSSTCFSYAHHLAGEAFAVDVFVYRTLAGLVFAAIFAYRSFAHAVYTHFLYDLYVFLLRE